MVYGDVIVLSVHGLHAVHAVHDKSGENHGESNPGVADPNNLQTNPAHDAGPTVYSCGIRGIGAALGRFCIKKSEPIISDELACSTYCQC